jgi:hypothetical protein
VALAPGVAALVVPVREVVRVPAAAVPRRDRDLAPVVARVQEPVAPERVLMVVQVQVVQARVARAREPAVPVLVRVARAPAAARQVRVRALAARVREPAVVVRARAAQARALGALERAPGVSAERPASAGQAPGEVVPEWVLVVRWERQV